MKFKNLSVIAISLLLGLSGCDSTTTSSGGTGDVGSSTNNGGNTNNGGGSTNNGGGTNNGGNNQGGTTLKEDFTFRIGTQKSTSIDFNIDNVRVSYTNFNVLLEPKNGVLYKIAGYMYYDANDGFYGDDFIKVKSLSDSKVYTIKIVVFDQVAYNKDTAPFAKSFSNLLNKNGSIDLNLSAKDIDDPQTNLKYILLTTPSHGSLSGDFPDVKYSADSGYIGDDRFEYKVADKYKETDARDINFTIIDKAIKTLKPIDMSQAFSRDTNGIVSDSYTKLKWYDENYSSTTVTYDDAKSYCESLDVGDINDWRLPSKKEIKTIFVYNSQDKYIFSDKFTNLKLLDPDTNMGVYYWVNKDTKHFPVPLDGFFSKKNESKANKICVSGDEYKTTKVYGDKVIFSVDFALAYYKSKDKMEYSEAKPFCDNLDYLGYDDWHLGDISELSHVKNILYTSYSNDTSWTTTDSLVDSSKTYVQGVIFADIENKTGITNHSVCVRSLLH